MFLIYTDEAGNTGFKKDPDQPIHMIGALIVDAHQVRQIDDAVTSILGAYSPHVEIEVHGSEIFAGKGSFKGVKVPDRIMLVEALLWLIEEHDVYVGFGAVDKFMSRSSDHPHKLAFGLLTERLNDWLEERDQLGLIIADENHEVQQPIIRAMREYQKIGWRFGGGGTPMKRIIDTVHFVRSVDNRVLQLADLATYILCKAQRLRDSLKGERRELRAAEELVLRLDAKVRERLVFSRIFPRWLDK